MILKICGIRSLEDALFCSKADYLGFVMVRESPRFCENVREIAEKIPKEKMVLVFKDPQIDEIKNFLEFENFQLHGFEKDLVKFLKDKGKNVIKAVFPEDSSIKLAEDIKNEVDFFLFDKNKGTKLDIKKVKEILKGMGNIKDSTFLGKRYFVAGGITPQNIEDFLELNPYGIDVSSGVEEYPGKKSKTLVEELLLKLTLNKKTKIENKQENK